MRSHHRYIPIVEAQVGTVLGAPLTVANRGVLSLTLPAGHTLTDENMHQLGAHHAEFVCVVEPDERADEQVALDAARVAGRVLQIFEGADLGDPTMEALFDQVLGYRSERWPT